MTKQIKKTGKRSLAVFLSILMLMTSWVFVAPSASAATAGSYYIKITGGYKCSSSWRCSKLNNTFEAGWGGNTNDSAGMVVRYKANNGTASGSADKTVDMHDWGNDTPTDWQTKTTTTTVSGFPTGFYFCLDQNDSGVGGGTTYFHINKIEIGPDANHLTKIWEGTLAHESTNKIKKTWINQDGTNGSDGGSVNSTTGGWTMPYADSVSGGSISGADELTIPKTGASNVTSQYSHSGGTVKDQYGVNWYQDLSAISLTYYLAEK